jgi:hypothetical protein
MTKAPGIGDHQRTLSLPELGRRLPFLILSQTQVVVLNKISYRLKRR